MAARFYVPDLDPSQLVARLPPDEAHHLVKVLRLGRGATVGVFDGRGNEWRGRIEAAGREGVEISLLEPVPFRSPAADLTLVQAVLKGDAMNDVVRDCTMLGVATIQPILTARTTVKASTMGMARDRWQRIALASAKQCGAARLPDIRSVLPFENWLDSGSLASAFMLVEPSIATSTVTIRQLASRPVPQQAILIVGPEGGWTERERDRVLASAATALSLGPLTLRAGSVPLAAAAALLAIWSQ